MILSSSHVARGKTGWEGKGGGRILKGFRIGVWTAPPLVLPIWAVPGTLKYGLVEAAGPRRDENRFHDRVDLWIPRHAALSKCSSRS